MPRFGRPRANTGDSSSNLSDYQYTSSEAGTSEVSSAMPERPSSRGRGGSAASGANDSAVSSSGGSGRRGGKNKSITSGISTLFRRQPSPDFDESHFVGMRDPTGAYAGTRPTSATNDGDTSSAWASSAGDSAAASSGRSGGWTGGMSRRSVGSPLGSRRSKGSQSRDRSRSGSRGGTPTGTPSRSTSRGSSGRQGSGRQGSGRGGQSRDQQLKAQNEALRRRQREAQVQQQQQQYSQTQRDLLHKGAYDAARYVQQHEGPTQSQGRPGAATTSPRSMASPVASPKAAPVDLMESMSESTAGASDTLSGATSLSEEYRPKPRGGGRREVPAAESYDETLDTQTLSEGSRTVSTDGGTYESGDESTYDESTVEERDRRRPSGGRGQRDRDRGRGGNGGRASGRAKPPPKRRPSPKGQMRLPRRYRGFSTSISSLFLDESIVCGAVSCCGLLLSARTEHLLNERNAKRGLTRRGAGGAAGRGKEGARRAPSRILGVAWLVTVVGVLATYAIWGFGDQADAGAYEDWYDGDDAGNDDGGQYVANDDGGQNQQNDDGQNQQNDDGGQNQANDDGNQNADDGAQNDDGNANYYAYDDGNAANDDGNANYYAYDDAVAADDGGNNGDDAVQADDWANDDAGAAADDAAAYYQDDWNGNRRLKVAHRVPLGDPSSSWNLTVMVAAPRHRFNGIMKLREQREYIFDPAVEFTSRAYTNLMSQFKDDEFSPPFRQRLLGDYVELDDDQYSADDQADATVESSTGFEQGEQARTVLVVLFLFLLGVIGRRRRMRTRFAILRSRAQDDHLYYAAVLTKNSGAGASGSLATPDNTVMENFHEREDKYDGACSHTLFGCYPVDSRPAGYVDDEEEEPDEEATLDDTVLSGSTAGTAASAGRRRKGGDFMARAMTALLDCCCGRMCGCWCQLFSVCALAQEAREARLLLPPSMQRIDILTHQPFHEYAKDVNNVRRRFMQKANRTWVQHYAALSHLSRYVLLGFVLITAFVVMTMLVHPMGGFDWGDALVLIATFTQSFLVLVIVFGIFHRSDLSFDAVVKFFAVGFTICVPVGFVLEAVIMNGLFLLYYVTFYILHWIGGGAFDDWYEEYYPYIHIAGELVNAYFIAALVEELCKYYGFRFMEHPDLIFLTGLDRSAAQARDQGGLDSYKYDSQIVSNFSRESQDDESQGETDSRGMVRKSKRQQRMLREEDGEEEPELRSLQQQAAAITTGMISVAVGLACAENFLYVFFLGGAGEDDGGSVGQEVAVLIFRSVFPVHALSAAMQSVNMIRKFIEERHGGERNIGVGRIIFPAILLHGTFDAVLLVVNAYIESAWDRYYENGGVDDDEYFEAPYNVLAVNLIAPLGIVGVMAVSFGWYSYQNKLQMLRLARYDMIKNRSRSGSRGFNAPNLV